jgi:hypothetical protein
MKKTLIYSVCFGLDSHFALAKEWAYSIRSHGYKGDLILITDREFEIAECRIIVAGFMTISQLWKASIRNVVDCASYDKILFLDSDIACLKNPEILFELEGIQIPREEPLTIKQSGLNPVFMTIEEVSRFGHWPASNAGTILIPGKDTDLFFTEWETEWRKIDYRQEKDYWPETKLYKGQMYDQGVLQAMICRKQFTIMPIPMDASLVGFPCWSDIKDPVLVHLCGLQHTGDNKRILLELMTHLRNGKDAKKICSELRLKADPFGSLNSKLEMIGGYILDLAKEILLMKRKLAILEEKEMIL